MTASSRSNGMPDNAVGASSSRELRRVAVSSYLGNTIEFYDFLLYGAASAIIFAPIFFSQMDPVVGTIASFATLAAGYVARPLGGMVFGHFGDRVGRKAVLITTMIMMGAASGLIGVLPTFDQIGSAAPILLVTLRLVQGLAVGGEWGGASLMAAEHAPTERRGIMTGISQTGLSTGGFLATVAVALIALLPRDDMLTWGWRIPFLVSFVLLGVGLFVRLKISESPLFLQLVRETRTARRPIPELWRGHRGTVIRAAAAALAPISISSLFGTFVIAYAVERGYSRPVVLTAVSVAWAVSIVAMAFYGALSDRVGRRPVFLFGAAGYVVMAFPLFWMIDSGSEFLLFAASIIAIAVISCAMAGPLVALLSEWISTEVRYSGLSVSYQLATVTAGLCPLIASSLVSASAGSAMWVSVIMMLIAAIAAIAVWPVAESYRSHLAADPVTPLGQPAGGS